jgi:hypothetical protein
VRLDTSDLLTKKLLLKKTKKLVLRFSNKPVYLQSLQGFQNYATSNGGMSIFRDMDLSALDFGFRDISLSFHLRHLCVYSFVIYSLILSFIYSSI